MSTSYDQRICHKLKMCILVKRENSRTLKLGDLTNQLAGNFYGSGTHPCVMQYVPLDCSQTEVSIAVIESLALKQGQSIGNHTFHLSCHFKTVPLWWHHSMETLSAFLAPLLQGHNKMVCLFHSMYYIKSTVNHYMAATACQITSNSTIFVNSLCRLTTKITLQLCITAFCVGLLLHFNGTYLCFGTNDPAGRLLVIHAFVEHDGICHTHTKLRRPRMNYLVGKDSPVLQTVTTTVLDCQWGNMFTVALRVVLVGYSATFHCVHYHIYFHTQLWFPPSDHDFRRFESDFQ